MNRVNDFIGSPASPKPAAATWVAGYSFEAGKIRKETQSFDAMTSALDLKLPYMLIQGREDRASPNPYRPKWRDAGVLKAQKRHHHLR
jgi:hypothetical protein